MSCYLISFPSSAMVVAEEELPTVDAAARAVVAEAQAAGVWVFGGALDEGVPAVLVDEHGTATEGTYPQTARIEGGYALIDVPSRDEALAWAARLASACRCAQEVRVFHDDPASRGPVAQPE